jgi:hypothetical protein
MGHGGSRADGNILVFEDEQGKPALVDARQLEKHIHGKVFLVTLNACVSAEPGPTEFGSLGGMLCAQKVPYTLGMRFVIADDDARDFSRIFYGQLARGVSVEEAQIATEQQPAWLLSESTSMPDAANSVVNEVIKAIQAFLGADDWEATRQVVEARQQLLFLPITEKIFEQNIVDAQAKGDERRQKVLEKHLALLQACKTAGIEAAFADLIKTEAAEPDPTMLEVVRQHIQALIGNPEDKLAFAQHLHAQLALAPSPDLTALYRTIQLALLGAPLESLGEDLQGEPQRAWQTIRTIVDRGEIDPGLLSTVANNTVAVFGAASAQRSEWRDKLSQLRNQATAQNAQDFVLLLDAVIDLIDSGGDPAGLGSGLQRAFARTWQTILSNLPVNN